MNSVNYNAVSQHYLERHADLINSKRGWQAACLALIVINAALGWSILAKDDAPTAIPYIVEVDSLGRAMAISQANALPVKDERIIKAHLFSFIERARTVVADTHTLRQNMKFVDNVVTPSVMANFLQPYYEIHNPFPLAGDINRIIDPVSFLKQGDNSYIIEWDEQTRDSRTKMLQSTQRWKALITVHHELERKVDDLKQDILNPFGLYITDLSWSKSSS